MSVYWAAGSELAELRDHRTGAERSQPLCHDMLFREHSFLCLNTEANTHTHAHTPFLDMCY